MNKAEYKKISHDIRCAALGIAQTSRYYSNDNRKIIDGLTGETIQLIRA